MATKVMSLRFAPGQMERLQRLARRLGRTPSETTALLVEESLRRSEFAFIDFRDSSAGRQAYVQGTGLAVWEVVLVAREYDLDAQKTAEYLQWTTARVQSALSYAQAFPDEIEVALQDNASYSFERLQRLVPQIRSFVVPADSSHLANA